MTPKEILIAGRKLIEKPENWTQRAFARNAKGESVGSNEKGAVCFCSEGAFNKASRYWQTGAAFEAFAYLQAQLRGIPVITFNDTSTHGEVLAAWDRAIEAAP